MRSTHTSHNILLFITVLIFGMAEASLQFTVPKASLKQTYLSDAPNLAWEGNLLIPASIGQKHTFFSEIHYINRMGGIQKELNTGLGYRYLANNNNLLGSYLFFDYNTTNSANTFNQITVGGEWFHGMNVIRGNVYVPLSTDKMVAVQGLDVAWQDQNNGTRTGEIYANEIREQAMYGTDVVAGRDINNFYVGIGGYYFWHKGYQEIAGPKLKVNYKVPYESKLIQGLKIESELSYDKVRGARTYAGVRVVFGEKTKGIGVMRHRKDFVERDIDIVTHTKARTLNYNDEMGTHYKIIESNTPPACASGTIWKVSGTATLNSKYTACSGSSIVGSNIPLPYKGTQYTIYFIGSTPTIQARAGFTGDLIALDGGDVNHTQEINGLKLINTNYANHTLALTHTFFKDFHNIVITNVESNGRMSFRLSWTTNVNLSLENVNAYVSGATSIGGSYTEVMDKDNTIFKYAPGVIEIIGGIKGNFVVSKFKNVKIGNGLAMPYSALLISGASPTSDELFQINEDINISGQGINLQKNGTYQPALLFLGKNVTLEHDIILPDNITLVNATGVVNTIHIGTISFNSNAPATVNLTNTTLIKNTGSIAHIDTIHLNGVYTLNNATLIYNDTGSSIDTVNQDGSLTSSTSGTVVNNLGTITTYTINDLHANNRSSDYLVLVGNQTGGEITTLSFTGTNTFSDSMVIITNESNGHIASINQSGTLNMGNGYGIINHVDIDPNKGIGNITLNGNINLTSDGGILIYNNGDMDTITAKGMITVSKETTPQAYIVYNDTSGKLKSITLDKVTDLSGLMDMIYNNSYATIGAITLGAISTDTDDTMTYVNNQGIINSITINYPKIDTTPNTIYVNNTSGTITDYVVLTFPTLTGTDPVLPVTILPPLTKFINITPQLNINADTVTVTRDTFLNLTTAFTAGWLIHDITISNITYSGSNAGTVISIGAGVTVNSVTMDNAQNFNTGINNAGTITTALIENSSFRTGYTPTVVYGIKNAGTIGTATISDSSIVASFPPGGSVYGIKNTGTIGTATISGSVLSSDSGSAYGINNATGGHITTATIENNSSVSSGDSEDAYGISNAGTIGTATISDSNITANESGDAYGIYNATGRHITTATIENSSVSSMKNIYGIYNTGTIGTAIISGSRFYDNASGDVYDIYNATGGHITTATIENKSFVSGTLGGSAYGIYNAGTITTTATVENNSVNDMTGPVYGIYNATGGHITTATVSSGNGGIGGGAPGDGSAYYGIYNATGGHITTATVSSGNGGIGGGAPGDGSAYYGIYNATGGHITTATVSGSIGNYGIYNAGTIATATVSGGNIMTDTGGGSAYGIYNDTGGSITTATIENKSNIYSMTGSSYGIYNAGTITTNATVSDITIQSDGNGNNINGYGIYNVGTIGTVTIENSSVASYKNAYGIYNDTGGHISTATVSGGSITAGADENSYGIYNVSIIGTATVSGSSIFGDVGSKMYGIYNATGGNITTATIENNTSFIATENFTVYGIYNAGTITTAILKDFTLDGGYACAYKGTLPTNPLQHSNITLQNGAKLTC